MEWLRLSPLAMSYLPLLLQHLVILIYLFTVRGKSRPTWLLVGAFAGLTLSALAQFVAQVVYDPVARYIARLPQPAIVFSLVALLQFAYQFPGKTRPREARLVLALSLLAAGASTLLWLVDALSKGVDYAFEREIYVHEQQSGQAMTLMVLTILLGFLWLPVVLLRQTLAFSPRPAPAGAGRGARVGAALRALARPQGQAARAPRAFAIVLACGIIGTLAAWWESQGYLPLGSSAGVILLIDFAFAIIYVDNSPEPSSFRVKLVGVSLVTILVVLGIANATTLLGSQEAYDQLRLAERAHIKTLLPSGQLAELPAEVQYIVSRPAGERQTPESLSLIYARDPGFQIELLREDERREQLAGVTPAPEDQRRYRGRYAPHGQHFIAYALPLGDRLVEIGYSYPAYRLAIHLALRADDAAAEL